MVAASWMDCLNDEKEVLICDEKLQQIISVTRNENVSMEKLFTLKRGKYTSGEVSIRTAWAGKVFGMT